MAKRSTNARVLEAPDSPKAFKVRVRMYRQGLGDCFLLTFPRKNQAPFQMLIDCGALAQSKAFMKDVAEHVRDTVIAGNGGKKAKLDLVVATHEHKDHLSGFNQAREVFDNDIDIGGVWLGWTENLSKEEIRKIKEARRTAIKRLELALSHPSMSANKDMEGARRVLSLSLDGVGSSTIAEALEYLKSRGRQAGRLDYLEPGDGPLKLDGVEGLNVYVLGPPKDPILLKSSEVSEKDKRDGYVYHLAATATAGLDAVLSAAGVGVEEPTRYQPFALEHRVTRESPYFSGMKSFVDGTYDDPKQSWRKVDDEWTKSLGQLALDLDSDTNNTSLVLAFEFEDTGDVLLFVGDAQVGNWKSWSMVDFAVPGSSKKIKAHDLLARTCFYKVGHHCSHNATLRRDGLELMNRPDMVAFIPLDKATAKSMDWEMPAPPLFKALNRVAKKRVVISDRSEAVAKPARDAGVRFTEEFVDYFLV